MILELRIPKGLQGRFSDVHILKGLRARPWDRGSQCSSRSSRRDTASSCRVSRFCKALGGLCTSCYLAGNYGQRETEPGQRKRARLAFERDSRRRLGDKQKGQDVRKGSFAGWGCGEYSAPAREFNSDLWSRDRRKTAILLSFQAPSSTQLHLG